MRSYEIKSAELIVTVVSLTVHLLLPVCLSVCLYVLHLCFSVLGLLVCIILRIKKERM